MNFEQPSQTEQKPEQKPEFKILTELDQKVLMLSAKNVAEMLLRDFPKELPDVIIFPDTTARPLAHIFRPILEKVAQERGTKKPELVFLQTNQGFLQDHTIEKGEIDKLGIEEAIKRDIKFINEFYDENKYSREDQRKFIKERKEEMREYSLEKWEQIKKDYESLQESYQKRAIEIDREGTGSLAIIDDFVGEGKTIEEIRRIFKGKDIRAYVLLGGDPETEFYKNKNIKVGAQNKYYKADEISPRGFHFENLQKEAIGVVKTDEATDLYAQTLKMAKEKNEEGVVSWEASPEKINNLREDMKLIGEKIAGELKFEKNE